MYACVRITGPESCRTPLPIEWAIHKFSTHRVHVDVTDLFIEFLGTENIAIVTAAVLPHTMALLGIKDLS